MNKKQSVQHTLEELDKEAQKAQEKKEREEMQKKQSNARPSLMKRIGIGILDFLFAGLIAAGTFFAGYGLFFEPLGYNKAAKDVIVAYEESHLFYIADGSFGKITDHYDENKSAIGNLDVPITYYYAHNERAKKEHKLDTYIEAKLATGYFEVDDSNTWTIIKEHEKKATTFLKKEYESALDYFYDDPNLLEASGKTFNILIGTILVAVLVGSISMYIIVPLINKQGKTFGYMIGKLSIINKENMAPISKGKIILRSTVFIVINYVSMVTIYFLFKEMVFASIPFFLNTLVLSVTKTNSGIHDFAVGSSVINSSLSNEFTILEEIKKKAKDDEERAKEAEKTSKKSTSDYINRNKIR